MRRLLLALCFALCFATAQAAGFTLIDNQGRTHTLAAYKGKWVLVNFWATWCPPCLEEIPDFVSLYESRKDLMVIGVAMDYQDPKEVVRFADTLLMSYPLVLGNDRIAAQFGKVRGLPTTFIYDPNGKLVLQRTGPLTKAAVEKIIGGK